ncbi:hypothetical protein M231_06539 [Tremella mesenterica]|uniref:Ribonuclease P/MRP protein subunit POP5 n=1 Tax=Tremella mesenterica TaxID=5217 RepID=A0A4Q1BF33_TREME|nr:uncharacterized protein TREMEDRAFT_25654 [Tremella mesenterica DSM 1558]EIW72639.1 hypothetical protein TREMEDRAFT_25654 [Tremella mesenterica DSM 1558]RXK36195.1 hypothetical protein M231_06539 [Tremella mesenterica]
MVRFKNRYLLVEFLNPSSLSLLPTTQTTDHKHQPIDDSDSDDEYIPVPLPGAVFLYPTLPNGGLGLGEDGGQVIYRSTRNQIVEVFGDEGWGRVASSFKVIYHSPLTSLTILRIARPHVQTLHTGITLLSLTPPSNRDVRLVPRVIGLSGTIRKCQNRAIANHRWVVACLLGGMGEVEREKVEKVEKREREAMERVEG